MRLRRCARALRGMVSKTVGRVAILGAAGQRLRVSVVGKGGVEPPRPYGHTDLNRARLPFRHLPAPMHQPAPRLGRGKPQD
jgi:hypothetical protein